MVNVLIEKKWLISVVQLNVECGQVFYEFVPPGVNSSPARGLTSGRIVTTAIVLGYIEGL